MARSTARSCPAFRASRHSRGTTFHTSRWDYDYTGGNAEGDLNRLTDKRVGIIGTGATSVQAVPHLARWAQELFVFQRTPSSIDERNNRPTDPEWAESLEPGWQQRRLENFAINTSGSIAPEDLVMDGWTDIARRIFDKLTASENPDLSPEGIGRAFDASDYEKMDEIRARVDTIVEDPATAAALKPWYRQLCKRPCFHDEYLQSFNRPNVTLVDTDGQGVDRITETGVVANGVEYELDCLIFATGFEVGTNHTRRAGYDLTGRDGRTLSEYWADGPRTLHGMHVNGFPNAFVVGHTQGGFTVNYPHLLEECSKQVVYLVGKAQEDGIAAMEVTPEAEAQWVDDIISGGRLWTGLPVEECTPSYYNGEGRLSDNAVQHGNYAGGALGLLRAPRPWRAADELEGLETSPPRP